jgi:hypothetical protein
VTPDELKTKAIEAAKKALLDEPSALHPITGCIEAAHSIYWPEIERLTEERDGALLYTDKEWLDAQARYPLDMARQQLEEAKAELAQLRELLRTIEAKLMNRCGNCRFCGTDLEWEPSHSDDCPWLKAHQYLNDANP